MKGGEALEVHKQLFFLIRTHPRLCGGRVGLLVDPDSVAVVGDMGLGTRQAA